MTRLALLALPLALAACDGGGTKISLSGEGGEGNVSIATGANGQISIQAPGVSIAGKLPKINLTAEDFDVDGLKLYPKSAIRELNAVGDNKPGDKDNGQVSIAFESPAALATVQAWFRDSLAKQKFTVQPQGNGFAGKTPDGEDFTLTLDADGEQKTKGRIEVRG